MPQWTFCQASSWVSAARVLLLLLSGVFNRHALLLQMQWAATSGRTMLFLFFHRDILHSEHVRPCRGVQVGRLTERDCSHCHSRMGVSFQSATFQPRVQHAIRPASHRRGVSSGEHHPAPRMQNAGLLIQEGQPLPNAGTCQHYRHSHRWLRFPCCGQRFPCDLWCASAMSIVLGILHRHA